MKAKIFKKKLGIIQAFSYLCTDYAEINQLFPKIAIC